MTVPSVYTLNTVAEKIKAGEWDAWVDTLPVGFTFTNQNNVGQSAVITSNIITVAGLAAATNVSVSGGEISIDGGAWTTSGTINNGQSLQVRTTSASSVLITNNVVVTLGAFTTTWQVSTGSDFSPNTFSFTNVTVDPSTLTTSNTLTLTGFNSPSRISVSGTGATISINGGAFVTTGDIRDGQTLQVRLTSNSVENGTAAATITLGTYSTTWTVTSITPSIFVEDAFSTALYTGTGAAGRIVNIPIDLSSAANGSLLQGGMIWFKRRDATGNNIVSNTLQLSQGAQTDTTTLAGFNYISSVSSSGFTFGANDANNNAANATYAAWNFRRAKKFFDIVTWTGNANPRLISHNLGVTPGMVIVKRTDSTGNWYVWHRSLFSNNTVFLNLTSSQTSTTGFGTHTASAIEIGADINVNASGGTYVAYIFAHDASPDGAIQCGSYTGNGSTTGPIINLGWEPQWVLIKNIDVGSTSWYIFDNGRFWTADGAAAELVPNTSAAEPLASNQVNLLATGFQPRVTNSQLNGNGSVYIYCAIRRGPMRVPTGSGANVLKIATGQANSFNEAAHDMLLVKNLANSSDTANASSIYSALTGYGSNAASGSPRLRANLTDAESSYTGTYVTTGNLQGKRQLIVAYGGVSSTSQPRYYVSYGFTRAPGFFDQVCYTGTAARMSLKHNLGRAPSMIWAKSRGVANNWVVYHSGSPNSVICLNLNTAVSSDSTNIVFGPPSTMTATTFEIGTNGTLNTNGQTYVAYLFGDVLGVSKAFSYSGNGSSQSIALGFNARFVLIKRTDAAGDWFIWDSVRGITGNDPVFPLNAASVEYSANFDNIETAGGNLTVNQNALTNVNVNAGTYIGYAIA